MRSWEPNLLLLSGNSSGQKMCVVTQAHANNLMEYFVKGWYAINMMGSIRFLNGSWPEKSDKDECQANINCDRCEP